MAGNQAGEHEIRERLDRMERELRRWRLGALGALSLTVLVVAAGALAEPAKRLSVQTLKLVDREGLLAAEHFLALYSLLSFCILDA